MYLESLLTQQYVCVNVHSDLIIHAFLLVFIAQKTQIRSLSGALGILVIFLIVSANFLRLENIITMINDIIFILQIQKPTTAKYDSKILPVPPFSGKIEFILSYKKSTGF